MTAEIRWYNEAKTVLFIEIGPNWTWEDIDTLNQRTERIRAALNHPIGYVVHAPHTHALPPGLSVTRLRTILCFEPNEKFAIIVGTSLFVQMMIASISGLIGLDQRQRMHFASTLEEAEPILAAHLPLLQAAQAPTRDPARSGA